MSDPNFLAYLILCALVGWVLALLIYGRGE